MDTKKIKEILHAMQIVEDDRKVDANVLIEALEDAICKAYRKHIEVPEAMVRVNLDGSTGKIEVYHQFKVVEEVDDDYLEISLEDAKKLDKNVELDGIVEKEVDIQDFGRAAAVLAKNVVKQRIREAEKQAVYDEYIDLLDEMVLGTVESVEEKFVVVNLGKTLALMPKAAQIPNEKYHEGEKIRVVITECNRESKGAQVLVSRSDSKLVRRLFEKEVPEIYQGIIEIKAIAREAGDRCKIAVYSKNPEVDARGACIGPRGSRVQEIIKELNGEKIEIFEWSDNLGELIKNAFSPAEIQAVFYADDKRNLIVVVDDSQLSLAIGKKGKNARLAVKLTGSKIDIKTISQVNEMGIDIKERVLEFNAAQEKLKAEKLAAEKEAIEKAKLEELAAKEAEEQETIEETPEESIEEVAPTVETKQETEVESSKIEEETVVEEVVEETKEEPTEIERIANEVKEKKKELKPKAEYVSRFERLATGSKPAQEKNTKKNKKHKDEEERRLRASDLKKDRDYDIKPTYSEEELEEIEDLEWEQENTWSEDIDYDDYDEYYDKED